ncbi:hypothetical protein C8Q74DRAFT_1193958 [Fomes fomentarius]|nr:hypothetical protein C8Q74DRAFT_1193958 [Fomes fomentarius]
MRPGKRKRWRYLRSLSFDNSTINPAIAAELARVLARATHLERLVFGWAERTLGAHPDLPPAFAAIKSIKHLVLEGGYQYTCRMLEAMHWPLETARLTRSEYKWDWHDPDRLDRMHPASLLRNACSTLKSLELDGWRDCSDVLPTYPIFPDLRSLRMKETWCPSTAQWVVTYPNLQSLTVRTTNGHLMEVAEDDLLEHALHRRLNLETHSTQTCWAQLESFEGTLLDLYLLGLPCRISSVSVDLCADSLQFFNPVMDHARPIHLNLRIDSLYIDIPVIGQCLQHAGLVDLRHLTLSISFYSLENEVRGDHIIRFLEHVLDALAPQSVEEFSLEVSCDEKSYVCNTDSAEDAPRRPPCLVKAWVHDVDVEDLARQIFVRVPSLTFPASIAHSSSTMNQDMDIPAVFLPEHLRLGLTNWAEYKHAIETACALTGWQRQDALCQAIITLNVRDFPRLGISAGKAVPARDVWAALVALHTPKKRWWTIFKPDWARPLTRLEWVLVGSLFFVMIWLGSMQLELEMERAAFLARVNDAYRRSYSGYRY